LIRDWAGYWLLAVLVLFEFWDAQFWHSHYVACCAQRSRLETEQQHQSQQRKAEYRAFVEIPTPIEGPSYDLPPQRLDHAPSNQDLWRNGLEKSNRNSPVSDFEVSGATNQALFSPTYPRTQGSQKAQQGITDDLA